MLKKYFILIFAIKSVAGQYVNDACVTKHDGSPGVCKKDNECQIVNDLLKKTGIQPTRCGFQGSSQLIVCCPVRNSAERISIQKCKEYKRCGPNSGRRKRDYGVYTIVGGMETRHGEFPHMAAVGWELIDGSGYEWQCGGSLVSEFWVITAGHCTHSTSRNSKTSEPTLIRLGEHNLKIEGETQIQDIGIEKIVKHSDYKPPDKYHDIALIRLKKQAQFRENVRPICLWQTKDIKPKVAIATGWGKIDFHGKSSDFLQSVTLQLIDTGTCNNAHQNKRNAKRGIISEQLCAGDTNGGKDTCQGDSGGPLQIKDTDLRCAFHLIGITSYGVGCGGPNSPAVYTRVSSYIDWIESVVWPN